MGVCQFGVVYGVLCSFASSSVCALLISNFFGNLRSLLMYFQSMLSLSNNIFITPLVGAHQFRLRPVPLLLQSVVMGVGLNVVYGCVQWGGPTDPPMGPLT